jgi:methionyl aminopeptidase
MVKTSDELALMRVSGKLLASVFEMLDGQDLDGMSTLQINDLVEDFITVDLAARPASKGQYGFMFVLNCSINHVVCHGVPKDDEIVRDGDIINLDITLEKNGFIADSSKTYLVGDAPSAAKRLVRVAQEAMWKASPRFDLALILATSALQSSVTPKSMATRSCANFAGMASVARCTRSRKS